MIGRRGSLHDWWSDPLSFRGPEILYRSTCEKVFVEGQGDGEQGPQSEVMVNPETGPQTTPLESFKTNSDKETIRGGPTTLTPKVYRIAKLLNTNML